MKLIDYFLILCVIGFITGVFLTISALNKEGTKCLANPISYGLNQIEYKYNSTASCTCSVWDKRIKPFFITSNGSFNIE